MRRFTILVTASLAVLTALGAVGCGGGGGGTPVVPGGGFAPILVAGASLLTPSAAKPEGLEGLDLSAVGLDRVVAVYELTTPAGEPFVFDALARAPGNAGMARVSMCYPVSGAGVVGDPDTIRENAPIALSGRGRSPRGPWTDCFGDGFARIGVRGAIEEDLWLAAEADDGGGDAAVLIHIAIGPPSPINAAADVGGDHPGVIETVPLYSSDSWLFGLPTCAISGDRTTVLCYEGDRADPMNWARYEMRLQHDRATGQVTGGASEETSPDAGNWRDHEIAALHNVLARVHGGGENVTLALSFDRGATFAQTETFGSALDPWRPRLVQLAIALDYSLAVLFWRPNGDGTTDLMLVRGEPSAFDAGSSPTAYSFDPAVVLHHDSGDVTPALMGATWSAGGDLVVGYAFTSFASRPDMTWTSTTENHVVVVPWGGTPRDTLVERDVTVGKDPSVAVEGQGDTLRIFYAWEAIDGVRLAVSEDAGRTFSPPVLVGDESAHNPTVFARPGATGTKVDVVHLAQGGQGLEIHVAHWEEWGTSPRQIWRLTQAVMEGVDTLPPDRPLPGAPEDAMPPSWGFRITQVAWLGYDACLDGDEIVLVYDEETWEDAIWAYGAPGMPLPMEGGGMGMPADDRFVPVEPPPLAPGLTEPCSPPNPDLMHQLILVRFS